MVIDDKQLLLVSSGQVAEATLQGSENDTLLASNADGDSPLLDSLASIFDLEETSLWGPDGDVVVVQVAKLHAEGGNGRGAVPFLSFPFSGR